MCKISILIIATVFLAASGMCQDITMLPFHRYAKPVVVNIQQQWTDTGIDIAKNDTVEIVVNGIASTQGSVNVLEVAWMGPEGDGASVAPTSFTVPGAAPQSVIGKIGTSNTGFYVGRTRALKANVAGRLYLGYNDDPSRPWPENFGYYVAFVVTARGGRILPVTVGVRTEQPLPQSVELSQNFPNPFNPTTKIQFSIVNPRLPHEAQRGGQGQLTSVRVFDLLGREVATLVNEVKEPGTYTVEFNGSKLPSGVYFYQLQAGDLVATKKLLLLK